MELEQSTPVSEIKGQVRHSNHMKKARAYNGDKHGDKNEDNSPKNVSNVLCYSPVCWPLIHKDFI